MSGRIEVDMNERKCDEVNYKQHIILLYVLWWIILIFIDGKLFYISSGRIQNRHNELTFLSIFHARSHAKIPQNGFDNFAFSLI